MSVNSGDLVPGTVGKVVSGGSVQLQRVGGETQVERRDGAYSGVMLNVPSNEKDGSEAPERSEGRRVARREMKMVIERMTRNKVMMIHHLRLRRARGLALKKFIRPLLCRC